MNNIGFSQTITGGCDKVTVTSIPSYSNNLYLYENLRGEKLCEKVSMSPLDLAGVRLIIEKYNFNLNKWQRNLSIDFAYYAPYEFTNLDPGKYRVLMFKPYMLYASNCPNNRVRVYNLGGIEIGYVGIYDDDPDVTSNEVWVGEAQITSSDASFSNTQGTFPNGFDVDEPVTVILTQNPKFTRWRGVIRDESTLEEYETGWQNVNSNLEPFMVSDFWEEKNGAPFHPIHSYKATIWVTNHKCPAWKALDMPFFTCFTGQGCKLQDQELSVGFYPNPASDNIKLQGLENIHKGDRIVATITDGLGKMVKNIPDLKSTSISVTNLTSGMYYLSVFRNQKRISTKKLVIQ